MIGPFDCNSNPTPEQMKAIEAVREGYKQLHGILKDYAGLNHYRTKAMDTLEQSAMWAIKSITHE